MSPKVRTDLGVPEEWRKVSRGSGGRHLTEPRKQRAPGLWLGEDALDRGANVRSVARRRVLIQLSLGSDVTIDYRPQGRFDGFWLRLRGSWLHEDRFHRHGTDVRVILRYDFQVI